MDSTQRTGLIAAATLVVVVTVVMTLTVARHSGSSAAGTTTTTAEPTDSTDVTPITPVTEFIRRPVEVDPRTAIRDGDSVDVTASGFDPGELVNIQLCADPPASGRLPADQCDPATVDHDAVDGDGTLTTSYRVVANITTDAGDAVDCRAGRERCAVAVVSDDDPARLGWATVNFDESVLPPPPARITVDPVDALVDGQMVTVTGRHFERNEAVEVRQCPAADTGFCWTVSRGVKAADDGTFTTTVPVWRLLDDDPGRPVDCASAPGACVLEASGADGSVPVPLAFDPAGPLPALPQLTVTPTEAADGNAVTVAGTGFLPGLGLLLEQCAVGADGDTSCLIEYGGDASDPNVRAGADGSFQGSLLVHRQLDAGGGVDCSQPGACIVLVMPYSYGDDIVTHANVTPAGVPITVT